MSSSWRFAITFSDVGMQFDIAVIRDVSYNAVISFPIMSAVFNALVLFCIRDISAIMQRMLNLKPNKDQKKYEVDVKSPDLTSCWRVLM